MTRKRRRKQKIQGAAATGPQRVHLIYDKERVGKLWREGPEVSEIKFDDEQQTRFIPNNLWRKVRT